MSPQLLKINDQNRQEYDRISEEYQKQGDGITIHPVIQNILRKCLQKNLSILDLGSGPGNNLPFLLSLKPKKIVEVDLSKKMILLAKKHYGNQDKIDFTSTTYLDYKPLQKFDFIFCHYSLVHVPHNYLPQVFENIYSWLSADGIFFANYFEGDDKTHLFSSDWGIEKNVQRYFTHYSEKFLTSLYADKKLNITHLTKTFGRSFTRIHVFARPVV